MKYVMTGSRGDVGSTLFRMIPASGNTVESYLPGVGSTAGRLLHLAAKSPPSLPNEMVMSNILLLQEMVTYCTRNNIEEIIFFSSASVYGNQDREDVAEETPLVLPSLYGISKLLGEELLKTSPLKVLCIRLPAILSTGNTTNLFSRIFAKLTANEPVTLTNADKVFNNFVSIESIWTFISGFEFQTNFDVVNLAAGKEMTLQDITELMRDQLGSSSDIQLDRRAAPFFNLSTAKAEQCYGYSPCVPQESITCWLNQRNNGDSTTL